MTSTRWATLTAFVLGSAGIAIAVTNESISLALAGAGLFMGSVVALVRHFWRQAEQRRHETTAARSQELNATIAKLRQNNDRLETSMTDSFAHLASRTNVFARGVLEYVAQVQLDVAQLKSAVQDEQKQREQIISQINGVVGIYATLKPMSPYPPFGGYAIGGDCAQRLVALILAMRPERIIEVGSGLSTLLAAQALELIGGEGQIFSLEHDGGWLEQSVSLLTEHHVRHRVEIAHAQLAHIELDGESFRWYDLDGLDLPDQAEVIFIDGPPQATGNLARYPALPLLIDHLSPTGVVLLDDASRADERAVIDRWVAEIPDLDVVFHPDSRGTAEIRRAKT